MMTTSQKPFERLECGCLRYCDRSDEKASPGDPRLALARSLREKFGEAWFDQGAWEATEFTSLRLSGDEALHSSASV